MSLKICGLLTIAIGVSALTHDTHLSDNNTIMTEPKEDYYNVPNSVHNYAKNVTVDFLNFGHNRSELNQRYRIQYPENPERVLQSKVNVLARLFKIHVDRLRDKGDQVELVFLVDSSASVGHENFRSELNFVRKLLSDFTVEQNATRVAVVTFASRRHIRRHIDQITITDANEQKCQLLNKQLGNITYTGGGTYTRGALLEALIFSNSVAKGLAFYLSHGCNELQGCEETISFCKRVNDMFDALNRKSPNQGLTPQSEDLKTILQHSREGSEKVVFLITDGFSNSGDPRPAAKHLKNIGATIFTFGIRTGNIEELHDIASEPGYTHSYLLDSFPEFEALARRALHRDLKAGRYVPVKIPSDCNSLCSSKNESEESKQCCDDLAICACGTATGHYACICPRGYFGSGLKGFCQPCPNGTFDPGDTPNDFGASCIACPHVNHVTTKIPATSADDCVCAPGFTTDGENCEAIRCPKLKVPENGYFVKASACSNVVNAACGLRCRIGFNLIGDSIRLCRNDGIWSGIEPQCLLKTCAALRAPAHGRIRCEHDENEPTIKTTDLTDHPIDTRCQFKCDIGFQLRGSKVRNCLPLSRWDGLKVACKQIKCEPLRRLANGNITPEICTGSKKLPYATNCTFSCDAGFVLIGPKIRHCTGKNGIWSQRHSVNQCVDKTPPIITCPTNSTWETLPGKNHALVNWTIPIASDTSDKIPKVWSKPHISLPWKARVGSHRIVYVAQDSSGNRARCKFVIRVIDTEPPAVEDCVDPPIFLTARQTGEENVTWNEPIFHDNSGRPVKIDKSHQTPQCINCPLGKTQIFYNATDVFHNSASCIINVTIKDACKDIPILSNGQANCQMIGDKAVKCAMTCDEGYGFTFGQPDPLDETIILTCGFNESAWNITYSPDCSVMEIPNSVGRDVSVILQGNTSVCDNATLIRQLTDQITGDLASKMLEICGNNIDCSLVKYDSNCEDEFANENEIDSNVLGRQKRKIIAENRNNPKLGIRKLREKIEAMTKSGELDLLNNRTNQEIAKLALNLKTVFKEPQEICEIGRVLKKHNCTKCPEGTFHNTTREQCQACNFGEYQNSTATAKCIKCPEHKFTRKMHSKKLSDCLNVCQPGAFSRRKPNQVSSVGLEPCTNCDIGFYQPNYGQTFCHACPNNRTTHGRGSASLNDCFAVVKIEDPCMKNPCLNGGHCTSENGSFSCECQECYIGSRCESRQDLCESSPCLNEGECNSSNKNGCPYSCNCKPEFTGQNCETYIDECTINPCQNGGSCTSTDKDFNCVCEDGFEGDFCETKVNHCEPWTCEEGSICTIVDGTWKCLCKAGFLGLRCNLLPCDWIPCHSNAICLNIEEMNATRKSYRCVCPDGYEGADCSVRIDHCKRVDCLNDGKCVNRLLNYTCECPMTFDGVNCETELSSDFVLNFSEVGTSDYVIMKGPKKNLTEITICVWLQSVDTFNYGTVLSYATKYQDNSLTLTDYNGFVLYVNGEKVVTDITVNDGFWHFLCVDWKSYDGSWNAYVDGVLKDNGTHLGKKSIIAANGTIVIGQEQDRLGGGFSASEAFLGKLSYLDVWDKVLGNEAVTRMMKTCESYFGSIVAWAQIRKNLRGNVLILDGIFCRGCPTPIVTLKAIINVSEDGSEIEYSCEAGYSVRVGNWIGSTYKRRCLKHGEWEGYHVPICTKVKCGYPGYFPRGRVYGTSFVYGDEIYYSCNEGYEIRGNPHRFCNADGNWSGIQPICIGVTCKNLLAPENGDIEYIMEEHERDDISIIQVGQQLEFKCETGFRLSGERYLTCLETGKWDYDRPVCVPAGCRSPNLTQHVQVSANQSTILPIYDKFNRASLMSIFDESPDKIESSIYSFGDVVGLFCHDGYKFQGNTNLLIEFRLQCSTNGSWTGLVPDCVKLQCVSPANVENGKIFMIFENGTKMEISSKVNYSEGTRISKIHSNENSDESDRSEIDLFEKLTSEDDNIEISDDKNIELIPGTNILIVCDRGYEIKGEATRVCLESEIWSSDEPKCVPKNCSVEDHPVLGLLAPKINNSMSNFVNNLQEYKEKFTNVRGTFGNVSVIFEGNYYKEQVIFACENDTNFNVEVSGGKKYIQNLTWRCDDEGEWQFQGKELNESNFAKLLIGEVQICKGMTCDRPQIPSNGYIVNASNTTEEIIIRRVNETIILRCRNGYNIEGDDKVACLQNGTWSVMPTCRRVSCKNPPKILNAFLEGKSAEIHEYVFGNMITYKCIQGYRIFGQANARCLANGQWSKIHGKCSKISCGKPKIASGVMIYGRSYLYREQLTYKCPNGITKGTITCNSDGKWSVLPVCNSVQ